MHKHEVGVREYRVKCRTNALARSPENKTRLPSSQLVHIVHDHSAEAVRANPTRLLDFASLLLADSSVASACNAGRRGRLVFFGFQKRAPKIRDWFESRPSINVIPRGRRRSELLNRAYTLGTSMNRSLQGAAWRELAGTLMNSRLYCA